MFRMKYSVVTYETLPFYPAPPTTNSIITVCSSDTKITSPDSNKTYTRGPVVAKPLTSDHALVMHSEVLCHLITKSEVQLSLH